jgi:Spy/CpxP family protein refolding chaperone
MRLSLARMLAVSAGILVALLVLPDVAPASDQEPGKDTRRKWWNSATIRAELGLSERDAAAIEAIFQATVPTTQRQISELKEAERVLESVLANPAADERKVAEAVDRVETARSALAKTRTLMLFRIDRLLTPEQRHKLKAIHDRDRDRHDRKDNDHPNGPFGKCR